LSTEEKFGVIPARAHQLNPEKLMSDGKANCLFCVQIPLSWQYQKKSSVSVRSQRIVADIV